MDRNLRQDASIPTLFRTKVSTPAAPRQSGEGTTLNLSRTGCMIRSDVQIPIGTNVVLHLYPDNDPVRIEIEQASVRWSRDGRLGIQFHHAQQEDWKNLEALMTQLGKRAVCA